MNNTLITKKDASAAFMLSVFVPVLLMLVPVIIVLSNGGEAENISLWWQYAVAQGGILAAGLFLLFYKKHKVTRFAGFNRTPKVLNIFLLIALSISMIFVMNPVVNLWDSLLTKLGYESKLITFDFESFNGWQFTAAIMLMAVVPAFGEEIIYRGFMLEGFREKKFDVKAILISAALFTLMHKNVEQLIHPFVMGIVFGFIYCATESIWNTVLLHFFNNLFTVIIYASPAITNFVAGSWWMMFIGLPVAAAALYLIFKGRDKAEYTLNDAKKIKEPLTMFFMIAALIYCLAVFISGLF